MPKKLFDEEAAEELEIKTDNEYAKKYNTWRKKEELHKLKARYGEDAADLDSDLSSSSEDDEDGAELTEEIEKKFFKTLSCLKNKDPRIYDQNIHFFEESNTAEKTRKNKEKKEKPVFIKDYERQLLLEKGGQISDSDEETHDASHPQTYVEEQQQLKESLKKVLEDVDEEEDEWGGMFKARQRTAAEKQKEEEDYKKWLAGQKEELEDKETEKDLKPLKEYWNNPNLDDGEKFLRDFILNKRYLEEENADYVPTYDEIVHDSDEGLSEDENQILKQEEFEHKYNYRFEEPDQEFIKRYPRTMENSLRRTDDRRKIKRVEVKERKKKEKEQKKEELKKLQELKRKEIEEKIQKLKEITGNTDVAFQEDDIEGDFDPEAHDRRMQSLFNDEFYEGPEDDQKPEFPDLDEELELERWDKWNGEAENAPYGDADAEEETSHNYEPHCEDEDFNMDCDYDPNNVQKELIENSKGKKKRRRKSKFAKMISEQRPPFDPNDKTYEEYIDEYYKFDCEDIIGDIPCRFKYRKVPANSFGLSIEEILLAKDRELNRWCSLKKAVQIRPEHQEKYDQIAYERKGRNLDLKKKILPSLFEAQENGEETTTSVVNKEEKSTNSKKQKKGKVKAETTENGAMEQLDGADKEKDKTITNNIQENNVGKNQGENESTQKKKKSKKVSAGQVTVENQMQNQSGNESKQKKKKRKKKAVASQVTAENQLQGNEVNIEAHNNAKSSQKNRKRKSLGNSGEVPMKRQKHIVNKKKKPDVDTGLSDARLSAYGINAKKFKNKLKYGNKKN